MPFKPILCNTLATVMLTVLLSSPGLARNRKRRSWLAMKRRLVKAGQGPCRNANSSKLQDICAFRSLDSFCYFKFYNEDPLEIGQEDDFHRIDAYYKCLRRGEKIDESN